LYRQVLCIYVFHTLNTWNIHSYIPRGIVLRDFFKWVS
jgi:hypothetical protein